MTDDDVYDPPEIIVSDEEARECAERFSRLQSLISDEPARQKDIDDMMDRLAWWAIQEWERRNPK